MLGSGFLRSRTRSRLFLSQKAEPGKCGGRCQSTMTFIACPDCAAIQRLKPLNSGRLECRQCGGVLENRTGRSIGGALACSITVLLLLFPMNLLPLMTVHIGSIDRSSLLASGLVGAWRQGGPGGG